MDIAGALQPSFALAFAAAVAATSVAAFLSGILVAAGRETQAVVNEDRMAVSGTMVSVKVFSGVLVIEVVPCGTESPGTEVHAS